MFYCESLLMRQLHEFFTSKSSKIVVASRNSRDLLKLLDITTVKILYFISSFGLSKS